MLNLTFRAPVFKPLLTGDVWPIAASANGRGASASLAEGIAKSAKVGLVESGVQTAKEALADCIKGDYPGGGMGLFSMPFQRPSAASDHCFR